MIKEKIYESFEIFITFFKIGAFTLGGGYAMLPLIEKEAVENKKWLNREEILDMFAIMQSLPGIIAVKSSAFIGYKKAGIRGAFFAAVGVTLPSFLIILLIAQLLLSLRDNIYVQKIFAGVRAGVTALILVTAIRLAKSALKGYISILIAIASFILIVFLNVHPVFTILIGGVLGFLGYLKHK
ncbi:chromate transporter [Acetivibrio saccincola]|jgi:chromate transporter|uniref:Chromate transport protein n=1 Tax=Acetivibrio saccincola TaxID=1677857 RepID=A0A2K9E3P0_9FIRM|nr:chromate transporter [Acetivibrio saccincola]AUG56998.1 Chromate transport protein [Acetivibrio saccincola]NLW26235.1 chromate transporter [Acetivibrio saccincola]PQQ67016.1 chromate transporter [Acetivibrio saccincola]